MLTITIFETKRVALLELSGRVDSPTSSELRAALNKQVGKGKRNLVLDLSDIEFIASSGLCVMVETQKLVKRGGGDLRIACPSDRVMGVLELAGLDTIFGIYPTQKAAIDSYNKTK